MNKHQLEAAHWKQQAMAMNAELRRMKQQAGFNEAMERFLVGAFGGFCSQSHARGTVSFVEGDETFANGQDWAAAMALRATDALLKRLAAASEGDQGEVPADGEPTPVEPSEPEPEAQQDVDATAALEAAKANAEPEQSGPIALV